MIGSSFAAQYPEGGGNWWVPLQYVLAFKKLQHKILWLELLPSSDDLSRDKEKIKIFQKRMAYFGLNDNFVLVYPKDYQVRSNGIYIVNDKKTTYFGKDREEFERICKDADVLFNLSYSIRPPLLNKFDFKLLVDLDPGLLQISAQYPTCDIGIGLHDKYLTIGENIGRSYCSIPTLGIEWIPFRQPINLDIWKPHINNNCRRFTTIIQWEWFSIEYQGRLIDNSKRTQFIKFIELPNLTKQEMELAVNIFQPPQKGEINLLVKNGWHLVDPHKVAGDPLAYQEYIAKSRAEFSTEKGVVVQLKSGWFSDRSICYLASGKPVLVQDTAIEKNLPVGEGLLTFRNMNEIIEGINKINSDYLYHCTMARKIAEQYFDSNKILEKGNINIKIING